MPRFTSVSVSGYRCLREFSLDRLALVNLITGPNNVGKTALLESLFLLCGATNPALVVTTNALRGITEFKLEEPTGGEALWEFAFSLPESSRVAHIAGQLADRDSFSLSMAEVPSSEIPAGLTAGPQQLPEVRGGTLPLVGPQGASSPQLPSRTLRLQHRPGSAAAETTHYLIPTVGGIYSFPPPGVPPFLAYLMGARSHTRVQDTAMWFDHYEKRGHGQLLVDSLRLLEPRLTALRLSYFLGDTDAPR